MQIRAYQNTDCAETQNLFQTAVRNISAADYSPQQIEAWLYGAPDAASWGQSLSRHHTLVATIKNSIVGFGDIEDTGYIDRLFVHPLFVRRKVATTLVKELELYGRRKGVLQITTHASITAKPFFEHCGYAVVEARQVVRNGIALQNYLMQKTLSPLPN